MVNTREVPLEFYKAHGFPHRQAAYQFLRENKIQGHTIATLDELSKKIIKAINKPILPINGQLSNCPGGILPLTGIYLEKTGDKVAG
jgi:hypothetical protein